MALFFLFLQLIIAGLFLFLCIAFITGGPFVPSSKKSVAAMVVLARIKKGMTIIDLGSGDGRVLFASAKKGATAIGYEMNPYLVLWTKLHNNKHVWVYWKNLWNADLSNADIVFVYLLPWRMEKLAKKLKKELKPGSLIISNSFIFPNWKRVREDQKNHIYVFGV